MARIGSHMLFGVFFISSCGEIGAPGDSIDPSRDFSAIVINSSLSPEALASDAIDPGLSAARRNTIIYARMAEIDLLYAQYERRLSISVRQGNFATALAGVVLGAAGSLAGTQASQNISALSGVIAGSKAAYDKEFLLSQTLQAIVSQMRANRAAVKERILNRLPSDTQAYPLQAAISDLSAYQQAGTLDSGIASITASAQTAERQAATSLQLTQDTYTTRSRQLKASAATVSIRDWIRGGETRDEQAARNREAKSCFDSAEKPAGYDSDYLTFMTQSNSKNDKLVEASLAACLRVRGFNF